MSDNEYKTKYKSCLTRRHYIIYIGINCKNRTTFYILSQKIDKCNVNFCTFFAHCSIFNVFSDYLENYLLEGR